MYTVQLLINSFEETHDMLAASERHHERLFAQFRAEKIAYVKGFFVRAGTYMTFPFALQR